MVWDNGKMKALPLLVGIVRIQLKLWTKRIMSLEVAHSETPSKYYYIIISGSSSRGVEDSIVHPRESSADLSAN